MSKKILISDGGFAKSLSSQKDDEARHGGYIVLFGDKKNSDLEGDYFTKSTDFMTTDLPVVSLYDHTRDKTIKNRVLGSMTVKSIDDVGVWAEGVIKIRDKYDKAIAKLIKDGKLSYSTGSSPSIANKEKSGEITVWPIFEVSLTPTPMEFRGTAANVVKSIEIDELATQVDTEVLVPESLVKAIMSNVQFMKSNGMSAKKKDIETSKSLCNSKTLTHESATAFADWIIASKNDNDNIGKGMISPSWLLCGGKSGLEWANSVKSQAKFEQPKTVKSFKETIKAISNKKLSITELQKQKLLILSSSLRQAADQADRVLREADVQALDGSMSIDEDLLYTLKYLFRELQYIDKMREESCEMLGCECCEKSVPCEKAGKIMSGRNEKRLRDCHKIFTAGVNRLGKMIEKTCGGKKSADLAPPNDGASIENVPEHDDDDIDIDAISASIAIM